MGRRLNIWTTTTLTGWLNISVDQTRRPHDKQTWRPTTGTNATRTEHYIQPQSLTPINQQLELADRADNVANYSHLLRAFGELSTELVNLGQCIMLAAHASHAHQLGGRLTRRLGTAANPEISGRRNSQRVTADYDSPNGVGLEHTNPLSLVHQLQHQPLGHSNSSSSQFAMIQATTTTTTGMRATNDSPLDRSDVEVSAASLPTGLLAIGCLQRYISRQMDVLAPAARGVAVVSFSSYSRRRWRHFRRPADRVAPRDNENSPGARATHRRAEVES